MSLRFCLWCCGLVLLSCLRNGSAVRCLGRDLIEGGRRKPLVAGVGAVHAVIRDEVIGGPGYDSIGLATTSPSKSTCPEKENDKEAFPGTDLITPPYVICDQVVGRTGLG